MDLDGDARLAKDEFIQGLIPGEPYSKLLKRQKDRERPGAKYMEKVAK